MLLPSKYTLKMSDCFSGWTGYHHKQPRFHHWPKKNTVTVMPFAFNSHYYLSDRFATKDNSFAKLPTPTTNMSMGTCGHGGAKAYFRFHGGIGDGCCGISFRNTGINAATRPLQLFDALYPVDFQNDMFKMTNDGGILKIMMTGPSAETNSGTGVFLPMYPKKIRAKKGTGRQQCHGGRMKHEDTIKRFLGDKVMKKKERKDVEAIPIELLLPAEWTY